MWMSCNNVSYLDYQSAWRMQQKCLMKAVTKFFKGCFKEDSTFGMSWCLSCKISQNYFFVLFWFGLFCFYHEHLAVGLEGKADHLYGVDSVQGIKHPSPSLSFKKERKVLYWFSSPQLKGWGGERSVHKSLCMWKNGRLRSFLCCMAA